MPVPVLHFPLRSAARTKLPASLSRRAQTRERFLKRRWEILSESVAREATLNTREKPCTTRDAETAETGEMLCTD